MPIMRCSPSPAGSCSALLKDLAVCHDIYVQPKPVLRAQGIEYQRQMIAAMQAGDADAVHRIMADHMAYAERSMLDLQAELNGDFLHDPVARGRTGNGGRALKQAARACHCRTRVGWPST